MITLSGQRKASLDARMKTRRSRRIVGRFLLECLTKMRLDFAARLRVQREGDPELPLPCTTCAFRTSTDGFHGFDTTTLNFLHSLAEGVPFACHEPEKVNGNYRPRVEDGAPILCSAFKVLTKEPAIDVRELLGAELVDGLLDIWLQRTGCRLPEWAG